MDQHENSQHGDGTSTSRAQGGDPLPASTREVMAILEMQVEDDAIKKKAKMASNQQTDHPELFVEKAPVKDMEIGKGQAIELKGNSSHELMEHIAKRSRELPALHHQARLLLRPDACQHSRRYRARPPTADSNRSAGRTC